MTARQAAARKAMVIAARQCSGRKGSARRSCMSSALRGAHAQLGNGGRRRRGR